MTRLLLAVLTAVALALGAAPAAGASPRIFCRIGHHLDHDHDRCLPGRHHR